MSLILRHPGWDRTCSACEKWCWRSDGTLLRDRASGEPVKRNPKDARFPLPCQSCPKPPLHLKELGLRWDELKPHAQEMTGANRVAYRFYLECKATGVFPDDPLVRWYAGVIRDEEDRFDREQQENQTTYLANLQVLLAPRRRR